MNENFEKALSCCKGKFQRDLVAGRETLGAYSRAGKARDYEYHYQLSISHLLARLQVANVAYHVQPGPRGGYYSSQLIDDYCSQ